MEDESLTDVAPRGTWSPEHDEHKQHDRYPKRCAGVYWVHYKRHYYT